VFIYVCRGGNCLGSNLISLIDGVKSFVSNCLSADLLAAQKWLVELIEA
jgi:hypothetical protein